MMNLDDIDTITPTEYSRYVYIHKMMKGILNGKVKTLCDIGCGTGKLIRAFEGSGLKLKGIDVSEDNLNLARHRIGPLSATLLENRDVFDLNEQFDLVFLLEVLEHIKDDRRLLDLLYKNVVKAGCYLIISVPAHSFLYSEFDREMGHLRRYDKSELWRLLEDSGFKPLLFWSHGFILFHFIANMTLGSKKETGFLMQEDFDMENKTKRSATAVYKFPPLLRKFVSRINPIHRFFFLLDYFFKDFDIGIEYCVLCKAK